MTILENIQIFVNMIVRLDITDEYLVKCDFILNTVIFINAALNISLRNFENVMFYDFIYLAKGFRMRPKVRSTLSVHKTMADGQVGQNTVAMHARQEVSPFNIGQLKQNDPVIIL